MTALTVPTYTDVTAAEDKARADKAHAALWLTMQFVTLTATTATGSHYTVVKRPGLPTVVIHPEQQAYTGTLEVVNGRIRLTAADGRECLRTTTVMSVCVLEN